MSSICQPISHILRPPQLLWNQGLYFLWFHRRENYGIGKFNDMSPQEASARVGNKIQIFCLPSCTLATSTSFFLHAKAAASINKKAKEKITFRTRLGMLPVKEILFLKQTLHCWHAEIVFIVCPALEWKTWWHNGSFGGAQKNVGQELLAEMGVIQILRKPSGATLRVCLFPIFTCEVDQMTLIPAQ